MKTKWLRLLSILLISMGLFVTGCSENEQGTNENNEAAQEEAQVEQQEAQEEQQIVVKIQDGENVIAEKDIEIEEGNNLLDIMKENFAVEDANNFVTSIEGVQQNEEENKYWVFEINGEPVMKGAHETEVKKDDEVVWELKQF